MFCKYLVFVLVITDLLTKKTDYCAEPNITIFELIGYGAVKSVYRGMWNHKIVAISILREEKYTPDFQHGINMLKKYSHNPLVVKILTYSGNTMVTEFYPLNNAVNLKPNNTVQAIKLCLNYAQILETLHDRSEKRTVNCDSNDLNKTLSQLLVRNGFELVLNDVDSLAEVQSNGGVRCGLKTLTGNFVAPEQTTSQLYDEKTDIWKAASICDHFLSKSMIKYEVFELHRRCKMKDPKLRPSAGELVNNYARILLDLEES